MPAVIFQKRDMQREKKRWLILLSQNFIIFANKYEHFVKFLESKILNIN